MTNWKNIAMVFRLAQCQRVHAHESLVGCRAKACEVYPPKFVKLMVEGIKKEIQDAEWSKALAGKLDIGPTLETLMAVQQSLESADPPHEAEGDADLHWIYDSCDFCDDTTGALPDRELAIKARRVEIEFFKARGVYTN